MSDEARVLGARAAMAVVAGSMVGIGIFLTPRIVASQMQSPVAFFAVWLLAGVAALCGAVAYAELATMMPRAGGDYVYLREAYGPSAAFGAGWVVFGAVFTGSIAALAVPLCQYQLPALLGFDLAAPLLGPVKAYSVVAVGVILLFTAINAAGTRLALVVQDLTTWIPMAGFGLFAVWVLVAGPEPAVVAVAHDAKLAPQWPSVTGFAVAFMAVYFAYSGWNGLIYVAGEVRRPGRNIPLGVLGGTLAVTALYVLMCGAFVAALGMSGLAGAFEAGTTVATVTAGSTAGYVATLLIAFGLLGTLTGTILGGARVAFAMAGDGALWRGFTRYNRRAVPERALWVQAAWACVYVLSGSFEDILALVSLAMIVISALTVAAVFVLRRRQPHAHRPYRATGYPVTPLIFLGVSAFVLVAMMSRAVFDPEPSAFYPLLGLPLFALAFGGHWAFARLVRARPGS
jgi:basic amino acid/polyamine antiporter, APA family